MKYLQTIASGIDAINEKVGVATSWLTGVMVLVVCYDVVTRYIFSHSMVAVQELEWHLFAVIFLLAAAYTLKYDRHVRVDVLYTRFSLKNKAWVDLLGSLVFLIPFALLAIWTSKDFVLTAFKIHETSPDPGGLPARYLLKACIPVSFFLVFLQGITLAIRSFLTIAGRPGGAGEPRS